MRMKYVVNIACVLLCMVLDTSADVMNVEIDGYASLYLIQQSSKC
jgi:hypothetical protein